jgi:hypothetical protein
VHRRFIAFDIETAKVVPADVTDLLAHRPLGIACAAAAVSDSDEHFTWCGAGSVPAPQLSRAEAKSLVADLSNRVRQGYTLLSWNGLSFDFNILAEESGLRAECAALALGHVDMMFHAVCALGHFIALQKVADALRIPGKQAGISGAEAPAKWAAGCHKEVMRYNVQDARLSIAVARACEARGELIWVTRKGTIGRLPLPNGWLSVREAQALPLPDTSWMTDPPTRAKIMSWMS